MACFMPAESASDDEELGDKGISSAAAASEDCEAWGSRGSRSANGCLGLEFTESEVRRGAE
jgi:hypothetical protein